MNEVIEPSAIRQAEVITVGTELLLGQTVNTNAAQLGLFLSELGISVYRMSVVGDNKGRLSEAISQAMSRVDLVILCGGLGPTDDDITMQVAATVAGHRLVRNDAVWETIQSHFTARGFSVPEKNVKQAMLPAGQTVLENKNGTAPGAIIEGKSAGRTVYLVLLPGPPDELTPMFENAVRPWLEARTEDRFEHRYIRLAGIGESAAEAAIADLIEKQSAVTIAPYASVGQVYLRVSQRMPRQDTDDTDLRSVVAQIRARLGEYIYEIGPRDLPEVVHDLLKQKNMTIALAESITGGQLSAELTRFPGSSAVFMGGVVCYSNASKIRDVGVDAAVLSEHGAVSAIAAKQLAEGVKARFDVSVGLSVTGLAGPGKGQESAEIGTCYIGLAIDGQDTAVHCYKSWGRREKLTRRVVIHALMHLWEALR